MLTTRAGLAAAAAVCGIAVGAYAWISRGRARSPAPESASTDLSTRAARWLGGGNMPEYIRVIDPIITPDEYADDINEAGYINFARAENRLLYPTLQARLAAAGPPPPATAYYTDMRGQPEFRARVAWLLQTHVFGRAEPVDPEGVFVSNGVGSMLEALAFAVCNEGDAILLPAPYYTGFFNDFETRPRAQIVPVPTTADNRFEYTVADLERAYQACASRGQRVRLVCLASPNNPMGVLYSEAHLRAVVEWAASKPGLHLLSDEVYALSIHAADAKFCSVGRLYPELSDRLHIMHGFSKDFGVSGFRLGVMYTTSPSMRAAMAAQSVFFSASHPIQHALSHVLSDTSFVSEYIQLNQRTLRDAYSAVTDGLSSCGIKFIPASAGFFVWVSLRGFMREDSFAEEHRLWSLIFRRAKINLSTGHACGCSQPGWFRLCFAAVSRKSISVAFARLRRLIEAGELVLAERHA